MDKHVGETGRQTGNYISSPLRVAKCANLSIKVQQRITTSWIGSKRMNAGAKRVKVKNRIGWFPRGKKKSCIKDLKTTTNRVNGTSTHIRSATYAAHVHYEWMNTQSRSTSNIPRVTASLVTRTRNCCPMLSTLLRQQRPSLLGDFIARIIFEFFLY